MDLGSELRQRLANFLLQVFRSDPAGDGGRVRLRAGRDHLPLEAGDPRRTRALDALDSYMGVRERLDERISRHASPQYASLSGGSLYGNCRGPRLLPQRTRTGQADE